MTSSARDFLEAYLSNPEVVSALVASNVRRLPRGGTGEGVLGPTRYREDYDPILYPDRMPKEMYESEDMPDPFGGGYLPGAYSPSSEQGLIAQVGSIPPKDMNWAEQRLFGQSTGARLGGGYIVPDRGSDPEITRRSLQTATDYVDRPNYGAERGLMQTIPLAIQQTMSPFGIQKMLGIRR